MMKPMEWLYRAWHAEEEIKILERALQKERDRAEKSHRHTQQKAARLPTIRPESLMQWRK